MKASGIKLSDHRGTKPANNWPKKKARYRSRQAVDIPRKAYMAPLGDPK